MGRELQNAATQRETLACEKLMKRLKRIHLGELFNLGEVLMDNEWVLVLEVAIEFWVEHTDLNTLDSLQTISKRTDSECCKFRRDLSNQTQDQDCDK